MAVDPRVQEVIDSLKKAPSGTRMVVSKFTVDAIIKEAAKQGFVVYEATFSYPTLSTQVYKQ